MLKKMKSSFQNNQLLHMKKMTLLTRVGVITLLVSALLALPIIADSVFQTVLYSLTVDGALISLWVTFILVATAVTLYFDYGKGNWSFLVALSSAIIPVFLGYYDNWFAVFNISWEDVYTSFEYGGTSFISFLLYLSNGAHFLALVFLIIGRPEFRPFFRSIGQKSRKFIGN